VLNFINIHLDLTFLSYDVKGVTFFQTQFMYIHGAMRPNIHFSSRMEDIVQLNFGRKTHTLLILHEIIHKYSKIRHKIVKSAKQHLGANC